MKNFGKQTENPHMQTLQNKPSKRSVRNLVNQQLGRVISRGISLYQLTISPDKGLFSWFLKGRICAHTPHCSAYGKECMARYGAFPGIIYTTERVLSCKPSMHKIYDPSSYRVVFFSGSPIGVPFLHQLHSDPRFDIVSVVTMPDKPTGRGHRMQENIIAQTASDLGISEIMKPTSLKQTNDDGKAVAAKLQSLEADFFVVVAYGHIMPQSILDIPTFGPINVHGSILPEYRGASPLQTVFLDNRKETGLTIMLMNEKMDEGDIVATYKFPIPFSWTSHDLFEKVKTVGPAFLADSLRELGKGHITPLAQDSDLATYCSKIEKQDGIIDLWKTPLKEVYNKYRAYALWPKIWTTISAQDIDTAFASSWHKVDQKTLIIESLVCDESLFELHADIPILSDAKTLNPAISSLSIKPEGKKAMLWSDFINGYIE